MKITIEGYNTTLKDLNRIQQNLSALFATDFNIHMQCFDNKQLIVLEDN